MLQNLHPLYMFQLTREEARGAQHLRSQIVILKRGQHLKYLPFAFTEHGAIMAANVLNIPRAVQMSVFVVRAFVWLRGMLASHAGLARKLADLERRYDAQFKVVFDAIRQLMAPPEMAQRSIGFKVEEPRPGYEWPSPSRSRTRRAARHRGDGK